MPKVFIAGVYRANDYLIINKIAAFRGLRFLQPRQASHSRLAIVQAVLVVLRRSLLLLMPYEI